MEHIISLSLYSIASVIAVWLLYYIITLRRVVPTNMVHIAQMRKKTVAYGRGKPAGNVYYAWPRWVPIFGITVTEFPESIFDVRLGSYDAYDQARLPFVVDVIAFFRVEEAETVAQRVSSFAELTDQLQSVLQGAVRRILATNALEQIMESRSELGEQFTKEVSGQIMEWGVKPVKTIEFMDLRDAAKSEVIANIMAKEKSRIDRESRVKVAENAREAQLAEIDAERTVEVQRQDAAQQVGQRTAEKDKIIGIANEQANQEIQSQAKVTAEKLMEVEQVKREREANIVKNVQITEATGEKEARVIEAEGNLQATLKNADGIKATGEANAKAEELMLMAPVSAQLALAKEIGENSSYQNYLISIEQVHASLEVGKGMAAAIEKAEIKIIHTGGSVDGGILKGATGVADMFTAGGGTKLTGMLAALSQTDEGKALLGGLTERLAGKGAPPAAESAALQP
jgi:flotillin